MVYAIDLGDARGQVASLEAGMRFEPLALASIGAQGYWEDPVNLPSDLLDRLMALPEQKSKRT